MANLDQVVAKAKTEGQIEKIKGKERKAKAEVGVDPETFLRHADKFLEDQASVYKYYLELKSKQDKIRAKLEKIIKDPNFKDILSKNGIVDAYGLIDNPDVFGEPIDEVSEFNDNHERIRQIMGYFDEDEQSEVKKIMTKEVPMLGSEEVDLVSMQEKEVEPWMQEVSNKKREYERLLEAVEKRFEILKPENQEKFRNCLLEVNTLFASGIINPEGTIFDGTKERLVDRAALSIDAQKMPGASKEDILFGLVRKYGLNNVATALGIAAVEYQREFRGVVDSIDDDTKDQLEEVVIFTMRRSLASLTSRKWEEELSALNTRESILERAEKIEGILGRTARMRKDLAEFLDTRCIIKDGSIKLDVNFDDVDEKRLESYKAERDEMIARLQELEEMGTIKRLFGGKKEINYLNTQLDSHKRYIEAFEKRQKFVREVGVDIEAMFVDLFPLPSNGEALDFKGFVEQISNRGAVTFRSLLDLIDKAIRDAKKVNGPDGIEREVQGLTEEEKQTQHAAIELRSVSWKYPLDENTEAKKQTVLKKINQKGKK